MTTIADWIASDEHFFPAEGELTIKETEAKAVRSLAATGWTQPVVNSHMLFTDTFPFQANALQKAACELIDKPGLYIIEKPPWVWEKPRQPYTQLTG